MTTASADGYLLLNTLITRPKTDALTIGNTDSTQPSCQAAGCSLGLRCLRSDYFRARLLLLRMLMLFLLLILLYSNTITTTTDYYYCNYYDDDGTVAL